MAENTRKRTATKTRLKDALMKLFAEYDFQSISVTMLCSEAGLHRSTFYLYYNAIDDVLREIEQEILSEIQKYSDQINLFESADENIPPAELFTRNEHYMIDFYKWQYSIREYLNPLLGAYGDMYFIQRYEQIIYDNFIPALEFLGYQYKDKEYVVRYITGGVVKTNMDWLLHDDICVEELVHIQRTMLLENPLLKN